MGVFSECLLGQSGCIILGFCFLKWSTLVLHCDLGKKMQLGFHRRRLGGREMGRIMVTRSSKLSLVLSRLQTTTHAGSGEDLGGGAHSTFLCPMSWCLACRSIQKKLIPLQAIHDANFDFIYCCPPIKFLRMSLDSYWPLQLRHYPGHSRGFEKHPYLLIVPRHYGACFL